MTHESMHACMQGPLHLLETEDGPNNLMRTGHVCFVPTLRGIPISISLRINYQTLSQLMILLLRGECMEEDVVMSLCTYSGN